MCERKIPYATKGSLNGSPSPCGSRFRDKYRVFLNERGYKTIEKVGETDIQELINSYADSVDLHKILEKCMLTGDTSALQIVQGVYADLTGYPADSRVAHDLMLKSRLVYEGLPSAQRALYPTFDDFMEVFANADNIKAFVDSMKAPATTSEGGEVNES